MIKTVKIPREGNFFNVYLYPYTEHKDADEVTIIILESGRFLFVSSVVNESYKPGKLLRIQNRDRDYTYSIIKEIYNLKESSINRFIPMYGKEWISGRGFITTPCSGISYNSDFIKKNWDFIPEVSDCPQ